jgi:hypothetical protein
MQNLIAVFCRCVCGSTSFELRAPHPSNSELRIALTSKPGVESLQAGAFDNKKVDLIERVAV